MEMTRACAAERIARRGPRGGACSGCGRGGRRAAGCWCAPAIGASGCWARASQPLGGAALCRTRAWSACCARTASSGVDERRERHPLKGRRAAPLEASQGRASGPAASGPWRRILAMPEDDAPKGAQGQRGQGAPAGGRGGAAALGRPGRHLGQVREHRLPALTHREGTCRTRSSRPRGARASPPSRCTARGSTASWRTRSTARSASEAARRSSSRRRPTPTSRWARTSTATRTTATCPSGRPASTARVLRGPLLGRALVRARADLRGRDRCHSTSFLVVKAGAGQAADQFHSRFMTALKAGASLSELLRPHGPRQPRRGRSGA